MNEPLRLQLTRRVRGYLRKKSLGRYGIGFLADTPQGVFAVDPEDWWITRALLNRGAYAVQEIQLLSQLVTRDSVICFVGAHIGTLLIPLATKVGRVIGYEADPKNFRYLRYNLKLNDISNATIFNFAIGDRDGVDVTIRHKRGNTGHSSIDPTPNEETGRVPMVTLGTHLGNETGIDLLVMDIEGAEALALRGMRSLMPRLEYLYTEFSPNDLAQFGQSRENFIEGVAPHYSHMYLLANVAKAFENGIWIEFLRSGPLPENALMNLLFSNRVIPKEFFNHAGLVLEQS